jgi:hypothetical protein
MTTPNTIFVAPETTVALSNIGSRRYDATICSLGYETRSRSAAEALGDQGGHVTAVGFPHGHEVAYEENLAFFQARRANVLELDDGRFERWISEWIAAHTGEGPVTLAFDVSSMTRPRIAAAVLAMVEYDRDDDLTLDFLYVPERYNPPPPPLDAVTALEPVVARFAGWDAEVDEPTVVLFGMGYEPMRAAGAIDLLEPIRAIPFFPIGVDEQFEHDVREANSQVLQLPKVDPPHPYRIDEPFQCFATLESLISELLRTGHRPVVLPFGPKIFALASMLAAAVRNPVTPVWRVSGGVLDEPADRQPEDVLVTLRVATRPIVLNEAGAQTHHA